MSVVVALVLIVLGLGVLVVLVCCCYFILKEQRAQDPILLLETEILDREQSSESPEDRSPNSGTPRHSIEFTADSSDDWSQHAEYDAARKAKWCVSYTDLKLEYQIGESRFGVVYKAKMHGLGERKTINVAVKKLEPKRTKANLQAFITEVELLRKLKHPNIVSCLGACIEKRFVCLVTDFWPRGALYSVLHDEKLEISWRLALKMCADAVSGMQYLHSSTLHIVHRDLKSHNLLVDMDFNVAVTDFELATLIDSKDESLDGRKQQGAFCGTPIYCAPEILKSQGKQPTIYTEKSDVYAMGIVMWEVLTRQDPFKGGRSDLHAVWSATHNEERLFEVPESCPEVFANLLLSCRHTEPSERPTFETIFGILRELQRESYRELSSSREVTRKPENKPS